MTINNHDQEYGPKSEKDADVKIAGMTASWALAKSEATVDLIALLAGSIARTQPAIASDLRRSLKALLESKDYFLDEEFANCARRLCLILEGDGQQDTFESIGPYISSCGVETLKARMFSPNGGDKQS